MTKLIKGVKLRLYPNKQQQAQLWQMFGNDRRVWNLMLDMAKQRYQNNPSSHFVNEYGMNYLLKQLKQEYPYLKDSDATSFRSSPKCWCKFNSANLSFHKLKHTGFF